jgi:hypothetical protein
MPRASILTPHRNSRHSKPNSTTTPIGSTTATVIPCG